MKPISRLCLAFATANVAISLVLVSCDQQSRANASNNPADRAAQGGNSVPPAVDTRTTEPPANPAAATAPKQP